MWLVREREYVRSLGILTERRFCFYGCEYVAEVIEFFVVFDRSVCPQQLCAVPR